MKAQASTYVLVHGGNMSTETWNKLAKSNIHTPDGKMGGRIWDPIIPFLQTYNNQVFAPTLKDEHQSNLTEHIEEISTIITGNHLENVVLVGHSYGGMVITGVATMMPDKISSLVYVDAALPDPGQSLFDLIALGGRDPLSFAGLEPAPPYVEKLEFNPQVLNGLPKIYILCTESEFVTVTHVAREKIASHPKEWTYLELPTSHVPMASMPEQISQLILENTANR
ncbi:alpha/beta hydrolase [Methanobacterium sp.]|uniref:alpha/beta fold hydrolase n=1 Tax=Methanobacterium sp. TaxID=2164 RepID=UPI002ABBFD3C|nr:alpha/beta hydrolase [Methanobacterium sp.]MDY9922836.1 alpha/beta hydrolase [Methanobacterium sp.]